MEEGRDSYCWEVGVTRMAVAGSRSSETEGDPFSVEERVRRKI